jgi:hypothetical protein
MLLSTQKNNCKNDGKMPSQVQLGTRKPTPRNP